MACGECYDLAAWLWTVWEKGHCSDQPPYLLIFRAGQLQEDWPQEAETQGDRELVAKHQFVGVDKQRRRRQEKKHDHVARATL